MQASPYFQLHEVPWGSIRLDWDSTVQWNWPLCFPRHPWTLGLSESPTWTISSPPILALFSDGICLFCIISSGVSLRLSRQGTSGLHALAGILGHSVEGPQRAVQGDKKNSLWVTKVTAQALGLAIATMVVQKHDLWLELVEMKEAKKVKFLDTLSPKQDCLMKRWRPLPSSSW